MRNQPAAVTWGGTGGFNGSGVHLASLFAIARLFENPAEIVEPFRIVFASLDVIIQELASFGEISHFQIDRAQIAQNLTGAMPGILSENRLEMTHRVG